VLLTYGFGAMFGPVLAGISMSLLGPAGLFYYLVIILGGFVVFAIVRILIHEAVPTEERSNYLPVNRTSQAALEMDPRLDNADDVEAGKPAATDEN
jgi:MFS family permease